MAFGKTPTTTTQTGLATNQFPASSVAVPNHTGGDLTALEGGPVSIDGNSNETAPASVYSKDGANVTMGLSTDANTVNSMMGRLTKIRDLLAATINVAVTNATALGQATMSTSSPVTIASDQAARTWTRIYSTTQTGISSWVGSGNLTALDQYMYLIVNINVSAITGTSIQFKINRIDGFAIANNIANGATISAINTTDKFSIGPGCAQNHPFGQVISITAALTAITNVTFTIEAWAR